MPLKFGPNRNLAEMFRNPFDRFPMCHLILAIVIFGCISGCSLFDGQAKTTKLLEHVPNTHPDVESRELDVRESVIRFHLSKLPETQTAYIAFGVNETWVKPPPQFIERFDDLKLDVRTIGDAKLAGFHLDSYDNANIYLVEIKNWRSDNSVAVLFEPNPHWIESGPNSVSRFELEIFEFRNGEWTIRPPESN